MEGPHPPYFWRWNETIGPIINRPGRPGTWGYPNTDGLGLIEMMEVGPHPFLISLKPFPLLMFASGVIR